MIISQSEEKPGLAVALAEFCKTEGVGRIWSGEAAAQQLLGNPRFLTDRETPFVLAAFAVGGEAGMRFDQVSKAIGLPILDLRRVTTELASGGVIEEVAQDRLQVNRLQYDLCWFEMFSTAEHVPSRSCRCCKRRTRRRAPLLFCLARGSEARKSIVPFSNATWSLPTQMMYREHFAWVDPQCANVILDKYREKASRELLWLARSRASPRRCHALLDADEAENAAPSRAFRASQPTNL